jgi:hypothetical protein
MTLNHENRFGGFFPIQARIFETATDRFTEET